jgi:hypothetical protein
MRDQLERLRQLQEAVEDGFGPEVARRMIERMLAHRSFTVEIVQTENGPRRRFIQSDS